MDSFSSSKKRMLTLAVLCAVGGSLAGFGNPVYAADETAANTIQTKDVVVTATKTEAEIKAVPQAVEVITSEDMERMGANDVLTALSLANNVNLSRAGMTGNAVSLRGMSTNHTLILIDGKRYAGEDTDVTTNVYSLQRLNVSDIERIEIVRGPSSSLYGSDAMGGVINIITKVPDKAGGMVGFVTGTRNTATYFNVNSGKHGRWTTSFDARFDRVRPFNRANNTPMETVDMGEDAPTMSTKTEGTDRSMYGMRRTYHLSSMYDFENKNQNKLRFDVDYMNEDLSSDYADTYIKMVMDMVGRPVTMSERWSSKNKKEWFHNEQKGFSLEYTGKTGRNDYQFRTYYNELEKDSNLINYPLTLTTMGRPIGTTSVAYDMDYAKYSTWVTEARNTMHIGDNHDLTFGGEYRQLDYEGTRLGGSEAGLNKVVKSKDVNSYAAYVEDLWQVNDKLLLIPSVRFEHNSQFGSEATPKIGATYSINNNWRLKANYGKGYKAPSISELYMIMHRSMGSMNVTVEGNPDLQPEETISYDFSIEADKGKNFGKLTYFNNKVTNLITIEALDASGYNNRYINIGKAQINGIELELGHRFNDRWTIKFTHNYLDAMDKIANERLNNRAKNTSTIQLIYDDHKDDGISAVLWDQFSNDYRYDDENYTYNTLNFSINKKWGNGFSTFAGVDNILNKEVDDLYIDGRLWRLGAEWRF